MPKKATQKPPTVITLTLPESDDAERSGTLLIQRGDLAHVRQFSYTTLNELSQVIKEGVLALAAVEADPPVIVDVPPPAPTPTKKTVTEPTPPAEPTVEIPLKKGKKTVKISHLKLVGGETDAAAYRQAVLLAGILIDGKLWDGESPIRIDDVYALAKKMKHLTAREMPLFSLEDFVQVGVVEPGDTPEEVTDELNVFDEDDPDDDPLTVTLPHKTPISANGHHNGVSDQTALL
jgi:hypothetical protein